LNGNVSIDGSSIYGMTDVNNSDLVLSPDLESYRRLPIYDTEFGNVAMLMCYVLNPDGSPATGCTRSTLKNELDKMNELGFSKMNVGFEPEFFILKSMPSSPTDTTCKVDFGSYADINSTSDTTAHIRREMMYELERAGIIPLTSHHERAASQFEITFKYADSMRSCDNLVIYKLIAEHVTHKHGLCAIFEPKLFDGSNGSGCHTNISLAKDDRNIFASNGDLSDTAKCFMSGILKHAKAITSITNPKEDSYKRFVKGCEAPTSICWGYRNRSAMIRVPKASPEATRIEVRSPDSTMNPYLGIAALLRAGLDGISRKLRTPKPIHSDAGNDRSNIAKLPETLIDAKREFEKSALMCSLGKSVMA